MSSPTVCTWCGDEHDPDVVSFAWLIEQRFGYDVTVHTPWGSYSVPRAYIALHGLAADAVPMLAARYGWPELDQ